METHKFTHNRIRIELHKIASYTISKKMSRLLLTLLATTATIVAGTTDTPPNTCVTYFNFTGTQESNTFFGSANADGSLMQINDLGLRFDPQGKFTVGKESFSFSTNSNATMHKGFGCCSKLSLLTVNKATGSYQVASVDSNSKFGPDPKKECGKYGCGIMEFAGIDDTAMTAVVWMNPLSPQPPPAASPQDGIRNVNHIDTQTPEPSTATPKESFGNSPNLDNFGLTLGKFNLKTGEIIPIRPFVIDGDNATSTTPMDIGMASYDAKNKNFWYACNPGGDFNNEGACSYPATVGKKPGKMQVLPWSSKSEGKTFTTTSLDYSAALKGAVVLGQTFVNAQTNMQSTKLFFGDPAHPENEDWATIVDLGMAWGRLHQGNISPCGKYYMAMLAVGKDQNNPTQDLVTVDLIAKKIIRRTNVGTTKDFVILTAFPC